MAEPASLEPAPGLLVEWDEDGDPHLPTLPPEFDELRVLTADLDDGGVLRLAAARPAGATGHDADAIASTLTDGEGTVEFEETLLSAQYAPDGAIRRIGLELHPAGEDYPMRAAGDTTDAGGDGTEPGRRQATLDFRLAGRPGRAVFEIVTR